MKIRSSQEIMRKEGIYTGAYAPYGYQKKEGKLYPEPESAGIVKLIYLMKLEGKSAEEIAKWLNAWGISSPAEHKRERGKAYYTGFQEQEVAKWSGVSVTWILKNRVYTGVLEQGKRVRISYKVRKAISVPKEKWITVKGTHKAIFSEREFELVQELCLLDMRRSPRQKGIYLFSGLLFCGDCKKMMVRRTGRAKGRKEDYYLCSNYNKGKGCTRHSISELVLSQIVWELVKQYTNGFEIILQNMQLGRGKSIWEGFIEKNKEKIKWYRKRMEQAEKDFGTGRLSQEEFQVYQAVYQREKEKREKAVFLCKQEKSNREAEQKQKKESLDRLFAVLLIKKIEICERKKVKIRFRFWID